ncbi:arsenic-transporting ATPase [Sutcliffiella cohnii]|uniref:Arsenic-transporting ATPase n=2 Tax=Sutcliffiella cohnii TaxID=33932 RepID=A0A223KY70_9BACI|nr:ArsA family ATPase [Sutcliffiella cohnii]AST94327.1 arsenic-transporting ATPase [Sutcliffiella cohnii]
MNNMNKHKKILFVGGKGGVGKSTSAAGIALMLAKEQRKTLLVSTDPAHNIGDIFHKKLKNSAKEVYPNLFAIEISPEEEARAYINQVKENIRGVVSSHMQDEVNKQIDAASSTPGAEEAALFDRIVSIILDEGEHYDSIIFDTAPTGHTIRLLTLPELMSVWIDGLLERRKKTNENYSQLLNDGEPIEDPIFQVLQHRKDRFAKVRSILLNTSLTGYIFTLNPERLPILETKKAIEQLKKHNIFVKTLIVNKVLEVEVQDPFWKNRKENEQAYLKLIEQSFLEQKKIYIPLFDTDINSVSLLEQFSLKISQNEQLFLSM